jgi:hypothetical protein
MASSTALDFIQCSALVRMCNVVELQATPYKTIRNWVNVLTRFEILSQELHSAQISVIVAAESLRETCSMGRSLIVQLIQAKLR